MAKLSSRPRPSKNAATDAGKHRSKLGLTKGFQIERITKARHKKSTGRNIFPRVATYNYIVQPFRLWAQLERRKSFSLQNDTNAPDTFSCGDFVEVRPQTIDFAPRIKFWVAEILEIRAVVDDDEPSTSIFLRVAWMYRPEDLPDGRQPYHGASELILSNHMDVIEAGCIESKVAVEAWKESADQNQMLDKDELFFRQTYDIVSAQLSPDLPKHCQDQQPWNPDHILVRCDSCSAWLHSTCIERAACVEAFASHQAMNPEKDTNISNPVFTAKVDSPSADTIRLTVKELAPDGGSWFTSLKCLLCGYVIYDAPTRNQQLLDAMMAILTEHGDEESDDTEDTDKNDGDLQHVVEFSGEDLVHQSHSRSG